MKYHCLLNYVAHETKLKIIQIIIRCKCFFFFTGQEPTTWPANKCLQIMVCSCAMSFNCFWLQILFCSCVNETTLFSFLRSLLRENGRSLRFSKIFLKKQTQRSNDKTIIELGYRKISWFVSVSQINYSPSASGNNWSACHWQIMIFCSTSSNNCSLFIYLEKSFITIIHTWLWLNWITLCIIKQHKIVMSFDKTLELKKYNSGF